MPAVIYQGFSIHGNEPSGANAAPLVAYYLAAARDPAVEAMLASLGFENLRPALVHARGRMLELRGEHREAIEAYEEERRLSPAGSMHAGCTGFRTVMPISIRSGITSEMFPSL